MSTLLWIIIFGFLMSCIALVGCVTLFLPQKVWEKMLLPFVAFAAGSLIGGAVLHMIPSAVGSMGNTTSVYVWLMAGYMLFYALEEFLNWHHSHTHAHSCGPLSPEHEHPSAQCDTNSATYVHGLDRQFPNGTHLDSTTATVNDDPEQALHRKASIESSVDEVISMSDDDTSDPSGEETQKNQPSPTTKDLSPEKKGKTPMTYLILIADGVHNFIGGLFVGASFVQSTELGISAWIAAAAHEIPQELGDFAILVQGGFSKRQALLWNFVSALTFLLGGIIAYAVSRTLNVSFLIPFAAGNFLYIGGSDLIPEVKHYHGAKRSAIHFSCFTLGVAIMLGIRVIMKGW